MNRSEIAAILSAQYDLSHDLHTEAARIRESHGNGFLNDPHYLMVSSIIAGVQATITALQLLSVATVPSAPAPAVSAA